MAPRKAGASYAADRVLSSVAGRSSRECCIDSLKRTSATEELQRHIDGRRYGRASDRNPQRLRDLAEPALQTRGDIIESGVYRQCIPLGHLIQSLTHLGECVTAFSAQVFRGRFGIDLDMLGEEEAAVVRHLLQCLGALTLCHDHPLEKSLIGAVAPQAAQLGAQ